MNQVYTQFHHQYSQIHRQHILQEVVDIHIQYNPIRNQLLILHKLSRKNQKQHHSQLRHRQSNQTNNQTQFVQHIHLHLNMQYNQNHIN